MILLMFIGARRVHGGSEDDERGSPGANDLEPAQGNEDVSLFNRTIPGKSLEGHLHHLCIGLLRSIITSFFLSLNRIFR